MTNQLSFVEMFNKIEEYIDNNTHFYLEGITSVSDYSATLRVTDEVSGEIDFIEVYYDELLKK